MKKPTSKAAVQTSTASLPATRKTSSAQSRKVFRAETPEGVNMDELADKIAARMRDAELTSNSVQGQGVDSFAAPLPSSLVLRQEPTKKTTPIDGAMTDLQNDLTELEASISYLVQAIDPILTYESDSEKVECGMVLAAISPMHSRILGLSSLVRELNARVVNTRERVQL